MTSRPAQRAPALPAAPLRTAAQGAAQFPASAWLAARSVFPAGPTGSCPAPRVQHRARRAARAQSASGGARGRHIAQAPDVCARLLCVSGACELTLPAGGPGSLPSDRLLQYSPAEVSDLPSDSWLRASVSSSDRWGMWQGCVDGWDPPELHSACAVRAQDRSSLLWLYHHQHHPGSPGELGPAPDCGHTHPTCLLAPRCSGLGQGPGVRRGKGPS